MFHFKPKTVSSTPNQIVRQPMGRRDVLYFRVCLYILKYNLEDMCSTYRPHPHRSAPLIDLVSIAPTISLASPSLLVRCIYANPRAYLVVYFWCRLLSSSVYFKVCALFPKCLVGLIVNYFISTIYLFSSLSFVVCRAVVLSNEKCKRE